MNLQQKATKAKVRLASRQKQTVQLSREEIAYLIDHDVYVRSTTGQESRGQGQ